MLVQLILSDNNFRLNLEGTTSLNRSKFFTKGCQVFAIPLNGFLVHCTFHFLKTFTKLPHVHLLKLNLNIFFFFTINLSTLENTPFHVKMWIEYLT